jgi:hypothetical protein
VVRQCQKLPFSRIDDEAVADEEYGIEKAGCHRLRAEAANRRRQVADVEVARARESYRSLEYKGTPPKLCEVRKTARTCEKLDRRRDLVDTARQLAENVGTRSNISISLAIAEVLRCEARSGREDQPVNVASVGVAAVVRSGERAGLPT